MVNTDLRSRLLVSTSDDLASHRGATDATCLSTGLKQHGPLCLVQGTRNIVSLPSNPYLGICYRQYMPDI